jgi:hypothetical protein
MKKQVTVYRQNGQWILSDNGNERVLPYYILNKVDVKEHVKNLQRLSNPNISVTIKFE